MASSRASVARGRAGVLPTVNLLLLLALLAVWFLGRSRTRHLEAQLADLRTTLSHLERRLRRLESSSPAGRGEPVGPAPVPAAEGPGGEPADMPAAPGAPAAIPGPRDARAWDAEPGDRRRRPGAEPGAGEITEEIEELEELEELEPVTVGASEASPAPGSAAGPGSAGVERRFPPLGRDAIDWEQFMGVKLFAWAGGLALFLGLAFFVKYSFEHDLIPPEARVAIGFVVGLGLVVGGVAMSRRPYAVTSQTLSGTGIVTLYAVTFASHAVYHFAPFGVLSTFVLMCLITATAFLLAVRLDALLVAVLGMLGGFLTPVLLSTGQDNTLGLFGYIALLDAGLVAVAARCGWTYLVFAAALGTVLTQISWTLAFFSVARIDAAVTVLAFFAVLFQAGFTWIHRRPGAAPRSPRLDAWTPAAAGLAGFIALAFASHFFGLRGLAQNPGPVLALVLVADLCLLALAWQRPDARRLEPAIGLGVFAILGWWIVRRLSAGILPWALAAALGFAVLHSVAPLVRERLRPGTVATGWAQLFPPLGLVLITLLVVTRTVSVVIWPVVLLVDLLAIGLAAVTASMLAIPLALLLTVIMTAAWITSTPPAVAVVPVMLVVIGGFALLFCAATLWAAKRLGKRLAGGRPEPAPAPAGAGWPGLPGLASPELAAQLPAVSSALPFLLLVMVALHVMPADPSAVFGLALLLVVLLVGTGHLLGLTWLPALGLACVLLVEHAWHGVAFSPGAAPVALAWYLGFYALFTMYPFVLRRQLARTVAPWAAAALAGPLHIGLLYRAVLTAFPNDAMGLVPALLALPALGGLVLVLRWVPDQGAARPSQLAWFGGSALFFITLIFPLQFDRQWLTLGWALEGAALLWLFHRVPHPGLRLVGVGLLGVAFVRLALNPAVLTYHARSAIPILNWYLYAYGVVIASLFAGARLLAPPRDRLLGRRMPPLLAALGAVLLFLLLNVEIADFFSEAGTVLTFEFRGSLAQDMTYSIAWALFALGLLVVGMTRALPAARYASLGLLGITVLKLFLHDLARLGQLYRVGALIGVAVIAIVASFLYQRFLARPAAGPRVSGADTP